MAKKTKVNVDLEQVFELSSKGYNVTMICEAIGISRNYAYTNKDIKYTIKRGMSQARQTVIDNLMSRSVSDLGATASIHLSKALKCFEEYYPTSTPKKPSDVMTKLANIYQAVARNELSAEKGDKLCHYLELYLKSYESNVTEERLIALEENLEKKS